MNYNFTALVAKAVTNEHPFFLPLCLTSYVAVTVYGVHIATKWQIEKIHEHLTHLEHMVFTKWVQKDPDPILESDSESGGSETSSGSIIKALVSFAANDSDVDLEVLEDVLDSRSTDDIMLRKMEKYVEFSQVSGEIRSWILGLDTHKERDTFFKVFPLKAIKHFKSGINALCPL